MRKTFLIFLLLIFSASLFAQKEYSGKTLGWLKMLNPNEPQKPFQHDHRNYSVKQMEISQMLVSWIQQSYSPKGGIGQGLKLVNAKLGQYNQHTKSHPHYYGAIAKTFFELKNNAGQWTPETNSNWFMQIAVNGVIGDRSYAISTPEKHYFYIPGENGLDDYDLRTANLNGFSTNPALKKYISWYQPKGISTPLQYVVLLCKDNVKPYIQITKGEYLEELGKAIENEAAKMLKDGHNPQNVNEQLQKRRAVLNRMKEKYKNRLAEPAKLKEQPDIYLENSSNSDVFENPNYPAEYPVYKFDPAKLALAKTDQPQWIVIAWDAEGVATNHEAGVNLHKAMLNSINYDYIYNYFFYPEKVKGIPYQPRQ